MQTNYSSAITLTVVLLLSSGCLQAQAFVERITDFFEFEVGQYKNTHDTSHFVTRVVLAPVVSYEPSTSLGMGVGAKLLFKPNGAGSDTRTSNMPLSLTYTLRNQFIFYSDYTIFFDEEKYLFRGNLELSKYPLSYYGIGNTTTEHDRLEISFNNFLFQPTFLRRAAPNFFVGGGFRYNTNRNTSLIEETEELPVGTSLQESIGNTSVGVEFAAIWDSRDNVLNASKGNSLELYHGIYGKALGGTHEFMLTSLKFRQYLRLTPNRPDVLALEWYGRYAWEGTPPLELSQIGGAEFMRGFQEGRFRDRLALFAQAEYRWQAFDRIGFVFFAGAGDVAEDFDGLTVDNLKYTMGTGLRIKIIESENLNIRIDYGRGFGVENDGNFYLGIAESF